MTSNHKNNIREFIPSSTYREKQVRLKDGSFKKVYERFHSGRWVLVENISTLLKAFAKKSIIKEKRGFLDFVENISAGNLKLVTKNTYNIFHSCKLNLSEIMKIVYISEQTKEYKELLEKMENSSYGPPVIYDLAMAIHFPFYDVEASYIPNIFNLNNSSAPNDWRNTFCIIRLLLYIRNNGKTTYQNLCRALESIGYDLSHVELAIQKSLDYCLLDTEFGTKLEHIDDTTVMELSSSGIYMVDNAIRDHRYLSYICEDTYMEEEYILPIENKYYKGKSAGSIEAKVKAVNQWFSFIHKEETNEIEYVTSQKGWDEMNFLRDFSPHLNGTPTSICYFINYHVTEQGLKIQTV